MTRNQILYQQHVETSRANRAGEALTASRDRETARSNLAKEFETNRANVARETETNRSNLAKEGEAHRSNLANEMLKRQSNAIQSQYNSGYLGEFERSHLAQELENNRHNTAMEQLTREGQDKQLEGTKYSSDTSVGASNYASDKRYDASKYSADKNEVIRMLTDANNIALEEMRQKGLDDRQLRQIAADAINVLHDDVADLIKSGAGAKAIRSLVNEYWFRRIGGN